MTHEICQLAGYTYHLLHIQVSSIASELVTSFDEVGELNEREYKMDEEMVTFRPISAAPVQVIAHCSALCVAADLPARLSPPSR